ncbi:MAG: hypothetical protein LUI12_01825 [Clostridiales bacterium]|nr:hypothetical protein [Clostridiales bacterium]
MTKRSMDAHIEGNRLQEKKKDEDNWIFGMYVLSAVSVAVEHNLAGKKAKSKYIEKPIMQQMEELKAKENLTEEEKKNQIEQFFSRLMVMQSNFELEKSKNEKGKKEGQN